MFFIAARMLFRLAPEPNESSMAGAGNVDHYAILGLAAGASPDEIKKAHKKMALKYHPDKNQGDEAAAKKFMEIQEAYQALSDEKVRAAYDAMCQAKAQREAKLHEMDRKRKADVEALEARERSAAQRKTGNAEDGYTSAVHNYQSELARMRERNKQFMQDVEQKRHEQNERQANDLRAAMESKIDEAQRQRDAHLELSRTIKVKWAKKGCVDTVLLGCIFRAYGEIDRAVAGKKSGIVVFKDNTAASNAMHAVATGSISEAVEASITAEWMVAASGSGDGAPDAASDATVHAGSHVAAAGEDITSEAAAPAPQAAMGNAAVGTTEVGRSDHDLKGVTDAVGQRMPKFSSWQASAPTDSAILNHRDYESITLMRMRQAAERQKLAEQIDAEDDAEGKF